MAEVHIAWPDGRSEARSVMPGDVITVGDSREPVAFGNGYIPLGRTFRFGGGPRLPYVRVRLHGHEMPLMRLVTQRDKKTVLPSPRSKR